MKKLQEPPEGIIITISAKMLKERGPEIWARNFLDAMARHEEGYLYYMRLGAKPTQDKSLQYVYLCIGGEVRYRTFYGGATGPKEMTFSDNRTMFARCWITLAGPMEKPPVPIFMKGFRGFRYTEKLW